MWYNKYMTRVSVFFISVISHRTSNALLLSGMQCGGFYTLRGDMDKLLKRLKASSIKRNSESWQDYEKAKGIIREVAEDHKEYEKMVVYIVDYLGL